LLRRSQARHAAAELPPHLIVAEVATGLICAPSNCPSFFTPTITTTTLRSDTRPLVTTMQDAADPQHQHHRQHHHAARDATPFDNTPIASTTDDPPMSPTASAPPAIVDPLVAQTALKLAAVINDFKRELDKRDGTWAHTHGTFEIAMMTAQCETYELAVVPDEDGDEYPITMRVRPKKGKDAASTRQHTALAPLITAANASATYPHTRRDSDAELEKDLVSRKKRKLDHGADGSRKRPRSDEDEDDIMPLITKEDLDSLLTQLREDIQEDTSECVNHVQKLLRRFKEEWHEHAASIARQPPRGPFRDSVVGNGLTPAGGAFPSPGLERDDYNTSIPDLIHKEAKLVSSQIRWVEDCRRVAADIHDKREENWRTSSAGFHDRGRQDRENFQSRMLHESDQQGRVLNQILNEVKAIGLYSQSMKWETPNHLATHPAYPPAPAQPNFPTQQPPAASGRGRGRGQAMGKR
jgi:hypothetical protein